MPEDSRGDSCCCKEVQLDGCRLQTTHRQRRGVSLIYIYSSLSYPLFSAVLRNMFVSNVQLNILLGLPDTLTLCECLVTNKSSHTVDD